MIDFNRDFAELAEKEKARRQHRRAERLWRRLQPLATDTTAVLIGGTGTGKSHLAIAIARACRTVAGLPRGGGRRLGTIRVAPFGARKSELRAPRAGRFKTPRAAHPRMAELTEPVQ